MSVYRFSSVGTHSLRESNSTKIPLKAKTKTQRILHLHILSRHETSYGKNSLSLVGSSKLKQPGIN